MLPQMHRWKALGNCCHKQENSGSAELGAWSSAVWWQQPFIFDGECWQNSWTPIPPLTICACKIWEFISLFCHRRVFAYPISLFGGDDGMGMGTKMGTTRRDPVRNRGANANLDKNKRTRARCYTGRKGHTYVYMYIYIYIYFRTLL